MGITGAFRLGKYLTATHSMLSIGSAHKGTLKTSLPMVNIRYRPIVVYESGREREWMFIAVLTSVRMYVDNPRLAS